MQTEVNDEFAFFAVAIFAYDAKMLAMNEMADIYRDWVAAGLAKKGHSKGGLAKALGIHQSQVTRMLNGARRIGLTEVPIIAEYLGSSPPREEAGLEEPPDKFTGPLVRVVGYVGAGAAAHFYAISQGDLDEVPAPDGSTDATVAVEIRGDSLGSLFDRWLVFYDQVRSPVTSDQLGRLCVVGLPDDRILVKKLQKGTKKGLFRLLSEREPPIEDVAVAWAARVKTMVPR